MDHQSPGRVELLDRFSDPDSPLRAQVGIIGTYRAQELFTYPGRGGDVPGRPRSTAGPVSRGAGGLRRGHRRRHGQLPAQRAAGLHRPAGRRPGPARLRGSAALRGRGRRRRCPTSGTGTRTAAGTCPKSAYGFPAVPGTLDAARRPFRAAGLGLPWYAVHGNHDNMLQGTVPADGLAARRSRPARSRSSPRPTAWTPPTSLVRFEQRRGRRPAGPGSGRRLKVTPDPGRVPVRRADYVREHFRTSGGPPATATPARNADHGHGLLRLRSRRRPVRHARHGQPARRLAGLPGRHPAGLAAGGAGRGAAGRWCCSATTRWRPWSTTAARPAPTAGSWPPSSATCCWPARAWSPGSTATPTSTRSPPITDGAGPRLLAGDNGLAHRLAAAGPDGRAARHRPRPGHRLHGDRQRRAAPLRRAAHEPADLAAAVP